MTNIGVTAKTATCNGRVLIVDDSRSTRQEFCLWLKKFGFHVEEAENGKVALEKIYRGQFDLVLLDVIMPGLDGLAVLNTIRRIFTKVDLPVVMVTSRVESEEIVRALALGANDYVTKPIDPSVLQARINNQVLQKAEASRLNEQYSRLEREVQRRAARLKQTNCKLTQEVEERRLAEETLHQLAQVVQQSPIAIVITDMKGVVEYANPKVCEMTGFDREELIGSANPNFRHSRVEDLDLYHEIGEMLTAGRQWHGDLQIRRKCGEFLWVHLSTSPVRDREGNITQYLSMMEDITRRKDDENRLIHQANYDMLTGLPNRALGQDRLEQAVHEARCSDEKLCVMFVDLDNFKNINDTLGHAVGDSLLVEAAKRLQECKRSTDTFARLGGDEFLVILTEGHAGNVCGETVASRILELISAPFILGGREVIITASIGLANYPDDGEDAETLMRNADIAMYQAKSMGRNAMCRFLTEMTEVAEYRLQLETLLRHALERDELFLHFQPIISSGSHCAVTAEALLRWESPEIGLIGPDDFIPVAETTGLIVAIGEWVLLNACRHLKNWRLQGQTGMRVAVNVSARQFRKGVDLIGAVTAALDETGLPADALELEITEGLLMCDSPETAKTLDRLKKMGVRLCMDDFGTGYSALTYLQRYDFDILKIDRSFVKELLTNDRDAALVRAIIAMAHGIGIAVVAEGAEEEGHAQFLRGEGCDYIQGYYYSRPLSVDLFADFLRQQEPAGQQQINVISLV